MKLVEFNRFESPNKSPDKILINPDYVETLETYFNAVCIILVSGHGYPVEGTLEEVQKKLLFEEKERPMARPHL